MSFFYIEITSVGTKTGQVDKEKSIKFKKWAVLLTIVVKISASTCLVDRTARNELMNQLCVSIVIIIF